ncbi:MAG: MoaD/ThiS family protein [Pedosphaera sp.]|nr:MoaD/ThiS family protein [Pedosphaera sp.]
MEISVHFYSYLKELTGCARTVETLAADTTVGVLHDQLMEKFPKLTAMKKSTLISVGVEYQPRDYVLHDGEEVSLFPPVQGG